MKILHFIYDDINNPWYGGGASLRTHEIYKRLAPRHDITVVTGNYPGAANETIIDGVKYLRLGTNAGAMRSVLSYSRGVFFFRNDENYDLIVKDLVPYAPTFTPLIRKLPAIASIQMADYPFFKSRKLFGLIAYLIEKISFKRHQNFIVPSQGMKEVVHRKGPQGANIAVVCYGVHDYLFGPAQVEEKDYVFYLGRFDIYHKGLDILLSAFQKVLADRPKLRLVLGGGGRETDKLKQMVVERGLGNNLEFVGRVQGKRKKELIDKSLFLVVPSRFESWGIVALEAGACGKAVVGTQIKCLSEAIRANETGILVPPEDSEALAAAILELASNKEKRRALGESGKKWAKKFSWDEIARQQEKFYEEVVRSK